MNAKSESYLTSYFPLWGVTFDSEEVGVVGDSIQAYIPYQEEWKVIQKSAVYMENIYTNLTRKPPVCLSIRETLGENETISDGHNRLGGPMRQAAREAVLALRLCKAGWFLDPELAEYVFISGFEKIRYPGAYRQAFIGSNPDQLPSKYELRLEELSTPMGDIGPITLVWTLIRRYQTGKPHSSADIAIENFNRSYGFLLSGTQKMSFLFTALDAMLGGMSTVQVEKARLASQFSRRVKAALEVAGRNPDNSGLDPSAEAKWLDENGREMRNAIAHGKSETVETQAGEGVHRLEAVIRLLLRQYLEFSVRWAEKSEAIASRFRLAGKPSPREAYNRLLDLQARQKVDASEVLGLELSIFPDA